MLVFVLGVTRGAPRLLDLVFDHRHDSVVRDPALTRTIVIEDVTEPTSALIHKFP
jgi:hypothetical protein